MKVDIADAVSFAGFCDFETDYCGYTQSTSDDFDWNRSLGGTASASTGPGKIHRVDQG